MTFPVSLSVERRLEVPRWLPTLTTFGAVLVAFALSAIVIVVVGGDPIRSYQHMFDASFGSPGVISDTLVKAIPLILTGLACALAFRMRLWNIGAEGQFLMGAWGASAVVLFPMVPAGSPALITIPLMMLMGFAAGALWGLIPGVLKARFGVNEIIVTLMLNYIAGFWILFWVFGAWSEGGFQLSRPFPKEAWLPRLTDFKNILSDFGGLTVHLGLLFGLVAAVVIWFMLRRTRWGYEIRLIGDNSRAARYAGVNIARNIIVLFMVSGGLAGLAGMSEVAGSVHRLQSAISPGYGFTAIIVAYLAKFNPIGVIVAAVLFGALILAGREIQPSGIPQMIQGVILFTLVTSDVLLRYRVRLRRRATASTPAAPAAA
jgi:general nucleoside transport system permease protein